MLEGDGNFKTVGWIIRPRKPPFHIVFNFVDSIGMEFDCAFHEFDKKRVHCFPSFSWQITDNSRIPRSVDQKSI